MRLEMKKIQYLSALLASFFCFQICEARSSNKLVERVKSRLVGHKVLITNDNDAPDFVKSFNFFAPVDDFPNSSNFDNNSPAGFVGFTYVMQDSDDQIYINFGEASAKNVILTVPLTNQGGLIEFQLFWDDVDKQYAGTGRVITVGNWNCATVNDFDWVEYICNSNNSYRYQLVDF